jgi:hypothetical protein
MTAPSLEIRATQEVAVGQLANQPILVMKPIEVETVSHMSEIKTDPNAIKLMTKDTVMALQKWEAGDEAITAWYQVRTPQGLSISHSQIQLAEKAGFVTIKREKNSQYSSWSRYEVKRLPVEVPDPKFRKPNKNSKWPWTFVQHWYVINNCPLRLVNDSFTNLSMKNISNNYRNWKERRNRMMQIDNEFPAIRRKSTLKDLRKVLEEILVHENVMDEEMRAKYRQWLVTPQHVVRTLISVGVQPSFEEGKIVGFEPINMDRQVEIAQSLVSDLDAHFLEDVGALLKTHEITPTEIIDPYIDRVQQAAEDMIDAEAELVEQVLDSVKKKKATTA